MLAALAATIAAVAACSGSSGGGSSPARLILTNDRPAPVRVIDCRLSGPSGCDVLARVVIEPGKSTAFGRSSSASGSTSDELELHQVGSPMTCFMVPPALGPQLMSAAATDATRKACAGGFGSPGSSSLGLPGGLGRIRGYDDECAGIRRAQPHHAVVRVVRGRRVQGMAKVLAGDGLYDRYSINLAPGRYVVTASNWPRVQHRIRVQIGRTVVVNFPNDCN